MEERMPIRNEAKASCRRSSKLLLKVVHRKGVLSTYRKGRQILSHLAERRMVSRRTKRSPKTHRRH